MMLITLKNKYFIGMLQNFCTQQKAAKRPQNATKEEKHNDLLHFCSQLNFSKYF